MKRRLWIGLSLVIFIGIFSSSVSAQLGGNLTIDDSESANVSVNVNGLVAVDITPATFTWTGVDPGGVGDNNSEVNHFYALQVENIGSRNITHVWFNATYPTSSPFGVGSNANTNSGNYVVLANETSDNYQFINRVEYNATQVLVYLTDPNGNMPPDTSQFVYGRIHNASNEYFWMINKSASGQCNGSAKLYIGNKSHSKTSTGTVNFQSGEVYSYTLQAHPDVPGSWGYADINSGPFSGYCVAVTANCQQVFFSRWNADRPFDACSNSVYAWDSALKGPLTPGESFYMKIKVFVPFGIYEGSSNTGYITAIASSV